jgi:flagellar basal body rod protein FlgG
MPSAHGTFDVKTIPQEATPETPSLGRLLLDKQFHGDLEAVSAGQMLSAGTAVEGSAVYVAIEQVDGTLHGRRGTFSLHHTGIMTRGKGELTISVIPDSGTGELVGLTGKMGINIADGKHSYDFDYSFNG